MSLGNPIAPLKFDFTLYRGRLFQMTVAIKEDDEDETPINLTGCVAEMKLRKLRSATTVFEFSPTIPAPAQGLISVSETDEFDGLIDGTYGWDIVITDGTGRKLRPTVEGVAHLKTPYTHADE